MKHEYAQTYQQATTKPDAPMTLTAPGGDGWQLHSWQHGPSEGWLTVVWQRERDPNAMSDVYAHAGVSAPTPVKTIEDMPKP